MESINPQDISSIDINSISSILLKNGTTIKIDESIPAKTKKSHQQQVQALSPSINSNINIDQEIKENNESKDISKKKEESEEENRKPEIKKSKNIFSLLNNKNYSNAIKTNSTEKMSPTNQLNLLIKNFNERKNSSAGSNRKYLSYKNIFYSRGTPSKNELFNTLSAKSSEVQIQKELKPKSLTNYLNYVNNEPKNFNINLNNRNFSKKWNNVNNSCNNIESTLQASKYKTKLNKNFGINEHKRDFDDNDFYCSPDKKKKKEFSCLSSNKRNFGSERNLFMSFAKRVKNKELLQSKLVFPSNRMVKSIGE